MNALLAAVVREATASDEAIEREYAAPIVIERGVPLARVRCKYPCGDMEVGDSFFVPSERASSNNVACAVSYWVKRSKSSARFATRQVEGGTRVWRVA